MVLAVRVQPAPPRAAADSGQAPSLHPRRWSLDSLSRTEPPSAGKFIPESNLGALQLRHRGGVIGGGTENGEAGRSAPPTGYRKGLHLLPERPHTEGLNPSYPLWVTIPPSDWAALT